ncbi:general transcriptional corepressor trfA [Anastrepha ludens]|uniref:general transcriptional corepressor trfA n=1 Tax=Anastrepha ludens TaxID=28586 RepID=UPI0023B0A7FE|nr:general transcriptional corepressor trfA [Anastrepha ludens]
MITGAEGRQTHTLLDLKKQQWAKEREEIARMDELISSSHHHQHSTMASSHHHKIERTSIRTYYSNMDVSQSQTQNHQRSSRQQQFRQQQQQQQIPQPIQPYAPELLPRYPQHNPNPYAVPSSQATMHPPHVARQQQKILRGGNSYDYELERYIDVVDDESDYEDDEITASYQRGQAPVRRASFMPRAPGRRNHTTSMMSQIPGQRKAAYDEFILPGASLQTAKARMQHVAPVHLQQPQHPQMRIRSPSLPIIRHEDYRTRQAQQKLAGKPKGVEKIPTQATQLTPAAFGSGIPVGAPSNMPHRSNNANNPGNPGCQEEDTSGYRSDSPKNAHTPEIWYNDGASLQGSSSTTNSGANGTDGSGVGVGVGGAPVAIGSVGGVNEVADVIARRTKRSITGQQLVQNQKQQQVQQYACDEEQQQQQILNSTYVVARTYNSGMENSCQGSYYMTPQSPSNHSTRDISTSNTYPIHPGDQHDYYATTTASQQAHEERERAKWSNYNNSSVHSEYSLKQNIGPNWLNRGLHELKDSEDDTQSMHSSYIRGQNAPVDPVTMAERIDKRRKAAEYHNAIKQQLHEREMQRKWEIERHKQEEMLEDERLRRQAQLEQERLEWERRQQMEREQVQQKKQQVMLDAIAKAEEAAKQEKQRKRKQRVPALEQEQEKHEQPIQLAVGNKVALETEAKETLAKSNTRKMIKRSVLANQVVDKSELTKQFEVGGKTEKPHKVQTIRLQSIEEPAEQSTTPPPDVEEAMKIQNRVAQTNAKNEQMSREAEEVEEEEKVLIGTPINMRRNVKKKTVHAADVKKESKKQQIYGDAEENVAVIMQPATLIPLPVTSDIFGLQNAIGNLQIATYWMQQQLKPNTAASTMDFSKTTGDGTQRTNTSISTEDGYQMESVVEDEGKGVVEVGLQPVVEKQDTDGIVHNDGKVEPTKKELALIPIEAAGTVDASKLAINQQAQQDVETQTELPLNCDLCLFHDNFYKVLLKREVSTTTTTQTSKSKSKPAKEADKDQEMTTTTTTTTTTTFKAKAKDKDKDKEKEKDKDKDKDRDKDKDKERDRTKRSQKDGGLHNTNVAISTHNNNNHKVDDRPKWGVNRPVVQYVKASERDPFYLRNKKKHNNNQHVKPSRSQSVDARLDNAIADTEDGGELRGADSACEDEGTSNVEEGFLLKARNVCTEILPIKTDEKGRIFLNFHEASAIMNEDEIKDKLRQRYFNFGRILPRRSWASATQQGLQFRAVAATAVATQPTAHLADD